MQYPMAVKKVRRSKMYLSDSSRICTESKKNHASGSVSSYITSSIKLIEEDEEPSMEPVSISRLGSSSKSNKIDVPTLSNTNTLNQGKEKSHLNFKDRLTGFKKPFSYRNEVSSSNKKQLVTNMSNKFIFPIMKTVKDIPIFNSMMKKDTPNTIQRGSRLMRLVNDLRHEDLDRYILEKSKQETLLKLSKDCFSPTNSASTLKYVNPIVTIAPGCLHTEEQCRYLLINIEKKLVNSTQRYLHKLNKEDFAMGKILIMKQNSFCSKEIKDGRDWKLSKNEGGFCYYEEVNGSLLKKEAVLLIDNQSYCFIAYSTYVYEKDFECCRISYNNHRTYLLEEIKEQHRSKSLENVLKLKTDFLNDKPKDKTQTKTCSENTSAREISKIINRETCSKPNFKKQPSLTDLEILEKISSDLTNESSFEIRDKKSSSAKKMSADLHLVPALSKTTDMNFIMDLAIQDSPKSSSKMSIGEKGLNLNQEESTFSFADQSSNMNDQLDIFFNDEFVQNKKNTLFSRHKDQK